MEMLMEIGFLGLSSRTNAGASHISRWPVTADLPIELRVV